MIIGTTGSTRQAQIWQVDQSDEQHPSKIDKTDPEMEAAHLKAVYEARVKIVLRV